MLYDCCKAFYAPNNMVLAAAGSTSMEQILAACARHGLMEARPVERVQRLWTEEPMTLAAAEKTITMPVSKPCFGIGFKEQPLQHDDLRSASCMTSSSAASLAACRGSTGSSMMRA